MTALLSQDATMLKAFKDGKDIYSTIAALAFNTTYDNCLEFRPDGTTNKEGKNRRTQAKSIVLGVLYGRGIPSIGEQLGVSTQKAQEIYDKVLNSFPALRKFIEDSQSMAKTKGYVTTAWGRRRHLDDMQLPLYEFTQDEETIKGFDALSFAKIVDKEVPKETQQKYTKLLNKSYGKTQKYNIIQQARDNGVIIKDNGGKIAQAERQCVNARVQGSSADLTKIAMISIANDDELNRLDFHLVIQVHDEVIGECPKKNAKAVKDRLEYVMCHCADAELGLPMKCDIAVTKSWYGEEIEV